MRGMGQDQNADLTPLLEDLRLLLRKELALEPDKTKYQFLRIRTPSDDVLERSPIALAKDLAGRSGP